MKDIIQLQRATVAAHIQAESVKNWSAVYDTFYFSNNEQEIAVS
jgi:hypothetical protein